MTAPPHKAPWRQFLATYTLTLGTNEHKTVVELCESERLLSLAEARIAELENSRMAFDEHTRKQFADHIADLEARATEAEREVARLDEIIEDAADLEIKLTAERDAALLRVGELERNLGREAEAARRAYDETRAENARLRGALARIAGANLFAEAQIEWQQIARDALKGGAWRKDDE